VLPGDREPAAMSGTGPVGRRHPVAGVDQGLVSLVWRSHVFGEQATTLQAGLFAVLKAGVPNAKFVVTNLGSGGAAMGHDILSKKKKEH